MTKPSSNIGVPSLLILIFITLKLTHYIDWSWWWVGIGILLIGGLIGLGAAIFSKK